jgi:hypothetical protein
MENKAQSPSQKAAILGMRQSLGVQLLKERNEFIAAQKGNVTDTTSVGYASPQAGSAGGSYIDWKQLAEFEQKNMAADAERAKTSYEGRSQQGIDRREADKVFREYGNSRGDMAAIEKANKEMAELLGATVDPDTGEYVSTDKDVEGIGRFSGSVPDMLRGQEARQNRQQVRMWQQAVMGIVNRGEAVMEADFPRIKEAIEGAGTEEEMVNAVRMIEQSRKAKEKALDATYGAENVARYKQELTRVNQREKAVNTAISENVEPYQFGGK